MTIFTTMTAKQITLKFRGVKSLDQLEHSRVFCVFPRVSDFNWKSGAWNGKALHSCLVVDTGCHLGASVSLYMSLYRLSPVYAVLQHGGQILKLCILRQRQRAHGSTSQSETFSFFIPTLRQSSVTSFTLS